MTSEATSEEVRQAIEAEERRETDIEHIRIEHDEHPDEIAFHDPEGSVDAWITAHGDSFVDLGESR